MGATDKFAREPREAGSTLLRHYENVADAMRSMREAAQQGDWDRVEVLEAQCAELIEALKRATARSALSAEEQRRRFELLRAILSDDAQIRLRAEPWLRNLQGILSTPRSPSAP
jgi:flagellar protein FliT